MIKLSALLKILVEAITSILPSFAELLCLLSWITTLLNDLKELSLREFLIIIDLFSLAFSCSKLQHQLVRILWFGFDPVRHLPFLSETVVNICWVESLRHGGPTLFMLSQHVIVNLLNSSISSFNDVSFLIHFSEDLILLS